MTKIDREYYNSCLTEHYEELPADEKLDYIKSVLHGRDACAVTFTKVNGDVRNMVCTLNESMIPSEHRIEPRLPGVPKEPRAVSTTSVPVFDLEKEAWRSFRVDAVTWLGIAERYRSG